MKKFLIATFIFTLTYCIGFSQTTFVKEYFTPGTMSGASSIVEDGSGGYFFNGWTYDSLTNLSHTFLTKCDPAGAVTWVKIYDSLFFYTSMKGFVNGDLLIVGWQFLIRTDSSGNIIWSIKVDGGSAIDLDAFVIASNGEIIVAANEGTAGANSTQIFKLDASGNIIWSFTTPSVFNNVNANKIIETSDGGFLIAFDGTFSGQSNIHFIKVDNSGSMIWSGSVGSGFDHIEDLIECNDGNFLFAGKVSGVASLSKIDTSGMFLWSKSYGQPNDLIFKKVLQSNAGNFIAIGSSIDSLGRDMLLLSVDSNGDFIDAKQYSSNEYGDLLDIKHSQNNGFIAIGKDGYMDPIGPSTSNIIKVLRVDSAMESVCNYQPLIVLDSNQTLGQFPGTNLLSASIIVNAFSLNVSPYHMNVNIECKSINVDELNIDDLIELYPNPSSNKLTVEISSGQFQKIAILDPTGKLVREIYCGNSRTEIDVSVLPKGLYFVNGLSHERMFRKRFVKN